MMNAWRATRGINTCGLSFAGDPRQSTAIAGVCQVWREHPSIGCGTLQGLVVPLSGRELLNLPFDWIVAGWIVVILLGIIYLRGRAKRRLAVENDGLRAVLR